MKRGMAVFVVTGAVALAGCNVAGRAEKEYGRLMQQHAAVLRDIAKASEGDFKEAAAALKGVAERYPSWEKSGDIQLTVGWIHVQRGLFETAREELARVYMCFPQRHDLCAKAMYLAALTFEKQGDVKNAVTGFRQVIDRYPYSDAGLRAPFHVCECYRRSGMHDEYARAVAAAVKEYRDVIGDGPDGPPALLAQSYILNTLSLTRQWDEAVSVLTSIAAEHPNTASAPLALHNAATVCRSGLNRPDKALALLDRLITEHPEDPLCRTALLEKEKLHIEQGDMERAEETVAGIRKACAQEPSVCAQALLSLAQGYGERGQEDRALALFEKVATLYTGTIQGPQAALISARRYRAAGRMQDAEQALARTITLAGAIAARNTGKEGTIEAYRLIASAYWEDKKWREGIAALKALKAAYPRENEAAAAAFSIGTIYLEEVRDVQRARFWYTTLIREYPDHRMAGLARRMLDKMQGGQS